MATTTPAPTDPTNWGDIPTWVGAVGTCLGTIFLILTAGYAIRSFGKLRDQVADQQKANERQAEVLALQADELRTAAIERAREANERRRTQAAQIIFWCDRNQATRNPVTYRFTAHVHNTSHQPAYNVQIKWHQGTAPWDVKGKHTTNFPHVLVGDNVPDSRHWNSDGNPETLGAIVEFTDAAGVRWMRREGGELIELPAPDGSTA